MNGEMMTIPTLEHVIEAVQTAVKKYPGGVRAMAAEMDMAPSSLGNVLNPYADRTSVKLGLEQAAFIMHQTGDVSALQLLAADLGFSLLPMCAEPDKGVEGEQLDDVERLADLQRAIRRNAPQKVRAKLLGALIISAAGCLRWLPAVSIRQGTAQRSASLPPPRKKRPSVNAAERSSIPLTARTRVFAPASVPAQRKAA